MCCSVVGGLLTVCSRSEGVQRGACCMEVGSSRSWAEYAGTPETPSFPSSGPDRRCLLHRSNTSKVQCDLRSNFVRSSVTDPLPQVCSLALRALRLVMRTHNALQRVTPRCSACAVRGTWLKPFRCVAGMAVLAALQRCSAVGRGARCQTTLHGHIYSSPGHIVLLTSHLARIVQAHARTHART